MNYVDKIQQIYVAVELPGLVSFCCTHIVLVWFVGLAGRLPIWDQSLIFLDSMSVIKRDYGPGLSRRFCLQSSAHLPILEATRTRTRTPTRTTARLQRVSPHGGNTEAHNFSTHLRVPPSSCGPVSL